MRRLTILLLAVTFLLVPVALSATTFDECSTDLTVLKSEVATAQFFGQNADKDRAGLTAKLDGAQSKLDQAKFADAVQKLDDFRSKVQTLSTPASSIRMTRLPCSREPMLRSPASGTFQAVSSGRVRSM